MDEFINKLLDKPIEIVAVVCFTFIVYVLLKFLTEESKRRQESAKDMAESIRASKDIDSENVQAVKELAWQIRMGSESVGKQAEALTQLIELTEGVVGSLLAQKKSIEDGFGETKQLLKNMGKEEGKRYQALLEGMNELRTYFETQIQSIREEYVTLSIQINRTSRQETEEMLKAYFARLHLTENTFTRLMALLHYQMEHTGVDELDTIHLNDYNKEQEDIPHE